MKFRIPLIGRILTGKDVTQYSGNDADLWSIMSQKYGVDYASRNKLKAYKNAVYDCVTLIAEALGDYEPYIEQKRGDQWEKIDHEFTRLLNNPHGLSTDPKETESFSKFDLFEQTATYLLLQGDCYWYMGLGSQTGRPREIVVLRPDKIGVDVDSRTGKINGYFIRQAAGDPIPLEISEVLRFKLFDPENSYKGKGIVAAASDYISTDESTSKFTSNFFGNNAGLSGVLSIKGEVSKDSFRKFSRAWRQKYQGVDNAGKTAIIRDTDATFTKVGLGLDQLDMAALRQMTLDDVFMSFKVPPALVGKLTDGTGMGRGNIETLEYIFTKWNIDKKMKRFDSLMQFALLRYYGLDSSQYRVCHHNIIPEDKEFELNERDKGVDRWLRRNEIRDEEGLDSIDGGDLLYVEAMKLPIGEATAPTNNNSTNSIGPIKIKLRKKTMPKRVKLAPAKKKDEIPTITKAPNDPKQRFLFNLMRQQLIYEKVFMKKTKPVFEKQRKDALDNLQAHSSSLAKANQQPIFDNAKYDAEIAAAINPVLTDLAERQGALALTFAGDTQNEFYISNDILSSIQLGTSAMAHNFNIETLDKLNKTLAEGIQNGEGIGALKSRVNGVYDDIKGYRAERIARTETLKASNNATMLAYQQTGYVTHKEWVVNPGACDECSDFDGKTVGLTDDFLGLGETYGPNDAVNDYDTIDTPPLHPNCRCTIAPVIDGTSSADWLNDEGGYIAGEEPEDTTVYHAPTMNPGEGVMDLFGDSFYVTRDLKSVVNENEFTKLNLGITAKDIYVVKTQRDYENLFKAANKYALDNNLSLEEAYIIPQYIRARGYKAVEALPAVADGNVLGVVDPKAVKKLKEQLQ